MMNNGLRIFLNPFITGLAGLALIGAFFLLRLQPSFAQNKTIEQTGVENKSSKIQDGRTAPIAESNNNSLLKALLAADNLNIDEATLLAPQIEKSRTLRISLVNQASAGKNGFSAEKPVQSALLLRQSKISDDGLARQRNLELSPAQILVVALNEKQEVLWWSAENDPRVLRVETADDAGRLSGGDIVYRNETELLVSLPADDSITNVRLYHPNWDGEKFQLELIGNLSLPQR